MKNIFKKFDDEEKKNDQVNKLGDQNKAQVRESDEPQVRPENNGEKIIGSLAIEKHMKHAFIALIAFKTAYGFPLKKVDGVPTLSLKDLDAWLAALGIDLAHLSSSFLQEYHERKRKIELINQTQDDELTDIKEMAAFTGRPVHVILSWFQQYDSFPGKKINGKYTVRARQLLLWMDRNSEPRGLHHGVIA